MPIHLFTVKDVCNIEGRGVLVIRNWHEHKRPQGQIVARVGDAIELRLPNGRRLASKIEAIATPHREILLPRHVATADIERGTEIWTVTN